LIGLSRPDATYVAGFKAWLSLGYCVRKGEKAIRIIAPMPVKPRRDDDVDDDDSVDDAGQPMLFKAGSVFDRSQLTPLDGVEQIPLEPPCEPLTGDAHAHLLAPPQGFTESLGFTVAFESIPGSTGGWCDQTARRIAIDAGLAANARLRILIHETIHARGAGYAEYGRERAEVIVDTATYVVAASVGLDGRATRRSAPATTRDARSPRAGFKRSAPAWSVQAGGGAVVIVALTSPA
jgi:hypothetical protein